MTTSARATAAAASTRPHSADAAGTAVDGAELRQVRAALEGFVDGAARATPLASRLWGEVRRASSGGKMVRPRLLLTTHRALGGRDTAGAVQASAALELLHTAFLIHDDVIDHDWLRRGGPTVAAAFRDTAARQGRPRGVAEHVGVSAAIIAGDLAIAGAVRLVANASADPAVCTGLAAILQDAVSTTAAGELLDVELAAAGVGSLDDVLAMYEAKTSVYSFCAPLQMGALLAGADRAVVGALGTAGRHLGVAYQIADDLLGLFGDTTVTGKPVDSDARENKQTVLAALHARSASDGSAAPVGPEQLRDAVERSGARAAAADLATVHALAAEEALLRVPGELRQALAPLLDGLLDRTA